MPDVLPVTSIKMLKGTQSTDPNQGKSPNGFILYDQLSDF